MNNSLNESFLRVSLKGLGILLRALPFGMALGFGRLVGFWGYYFFPKKRRVAYTNLKVVFGGARPPDDLHRLVRRNFQNLACSFVDLLCIPKIKRLGYDKFVTIHGKENIDAALGRGKGVIFLAVHNGSWELANIVGSAYGYPYNMVANIQPKTPSLNAVLTEYRSIAGAKVFPTGLAIRNIVKALRANEIVMLVLDQGGRDGVPIPFFGKTASISTGAMRLSLELGAALVPVLITRRSGCHHDLTFFSAMTLTATGDLDKDIAENTKAAVKHFEALIGKCPDEYLWFYKVYKYTTQSKIVILDDGRTGHLRQSQSAAGVLVPALRGRGKDAREAVVSVVFKNILAGKICAVFAGAAQFLPFLRDERFLRFFLTPESYRALVSHKPDYVISCGSAMGGVNFIYAADNLAKSIGILKPGLIGLDRFDLSILPRHDKPAWPPACRQAGCVFTRAAPNLITPEYLKAQESGLLAKYPRLKANARMKIGVLLGGNTRGVVYDTAVIHALLRQLKDAARHFNADLLVTTSRRTPAEVDALVAGELKDFERSALCVIANERNIPEAVGGILAQSDIVVVSGESISMVSEALSSGKRTIVFAPRGSYAKNKYDRFVLDLSDEGYLLAVSVKEISTALNDMVRHKFIPKALDDQALVRKAIEGIV